MQIPLQITFRNTDAGDAVAAAYVALRDAFDAARRPLENPAWRRRSDIKTLGTPAREHRLG